MKKKSSIAWVIKIKCLVIGSYQDHVTGWRSVALFLETYRFVKRPMQANILAVWIWCFKGERGVVLVTRWLRWLCQSHGKRWLRWLCQSQNDWCSYACHTMIYVVACHMMIDVLACHTMIDVVVHYGWGGCSSHIKQEWLRRLIFFSCILWNITRQPPIDSKLIFFIVVGLFALDLFKKCHYKWAVAIAFICVQWEFNSLTHCNVTWRLRSILWHFRSAERRIDVFTAGSRSLWTFVKDLSTFRIHTKEF